MSTKARLFRCVSGAVAFATLALPVVFPPLASAASLPFPASQSIDVAGSGSLTVPLPSTYGSDPVTYAAPSNVSTPYPGILLNADGTAIVTTGTLAVGTYSLSGTDSDTPGADGGNWTYTLTVTADTIAQSSPEANTVSVANSASFADQLSATPGFSDSVTFTPNEPSSPAGLVVSSSGGVTTTGILSATSYTISGTDSDTYGDGGNWTYTLTVTAGKVTLIQSSPTTGTVVNTSSGTFSSGPIKVEGNLGPVTFETTSPSPALTVSTSGLITTTGVLAIGSYSSSGTDSDAGGDRGTWTFTLIVTGVVVTVSFDANGGVGSMAGESESEPTTLALNTFTRSKYTFVDWNTAANGSGKSYANGAVFPFSETTTLFAQWKAGKVPFHVIAFAANGGRGSMSVEKANTPTAISANHFVRVGYTFLDWDSSSSGSGERFIAGAIYSFKKSTTLYAQWKKNPVPVAKEVTFIANGGTGAMARERHLHPAPLTRNRFTRRGYAFVGWSNSANGSTSEYANGAIYSFSSSTTFYARWKKDRSAAPPVTTPSWSTIGPFAHGSSALSPAIETLVQGLAEKLKSNGGSQISLLGYGDVLTPIQEQSAALVAANVALGRQRAAAVATYLQGRLAALGLTGWTISIAAASRSTSNSTDANFVTATLT